MSKIYIRFEHFEKKISYVFPKLKTAKDVVS